jgi:hypothetical protein
MTQRIPSETIEYERYVDGLRRSNAQLLNALKTYLDVPVAPDIGCEDELVAAIELARAAIAETEGAAVSPAPAKAITIHIEGGLVQDVNGIPAGYEVRVEDYDFPDTGDDSWDAEKKCVVTVYGGDGV